MMKIITTAVALALVGTMAGCHDAAKVRAAPARVAPTGFAAQALAAAASMQCTLATPCLALVHCEDTVGTVIYVGNGVYICVHNAAKWGSWTT